MRIAEYTNGSKTRRPMLTISTLENGRKTNASTQNVEGKRQAREIAAAQGAKCWNF